MLIPKKVILNSSQELLEHVIKWKTSEVESGEIVEEDNDQIWCVFDVDDFYKTDGNGLLKAIKNAEDSDIKIAYINEYFEYWILFHHANARHIKKIFTMGRMVIILAVALYEELH